jgi:hypothetical protein
MSMPANSSTVATPVSGSGTPSGDMGHEEVITFLGQDEDKDVIELEEKPKPKPTTIPEEKGGEKEEDKEEDEGEEKVEDELVELEQELEGPTEEQLELVTPVRRREILAKYPNLFKEFPYLEKAYYREQQFTELLPTIDDAKEAVEARSILSRFEQDVMRGNTETILKAVKAESPRGFAKLIDDYLPTLARVDEQAYYHVVGNITKHTIVAMVREAKNSGNEALQSAAQLLNQFVFGTSEFKPPTQLAKNEPREDGRDKELEHREQQFVRQQFESSRDDLNTRINNTLRNTIDANIDPKKSMTDYVRKNASREALEMLDTVLSKDARFVALKDKLWEAAFNSRFSRESVERIKSAYLSRAKTLLPTVIKKARIDALKGLGKRVSEEEETPNKSPVTVGRPRSQEGNKSGKITKASDIPKGMRTLDFLNSE